MKSLLKLPVPSWTVLARHNLYAVMGDVPLLVYTMGKVGSTSVYHSLRNSNVSSLIYHVHFLTRSRIHAISDKYKKANGRANSKINFEQLIKGDFDHLTASIMLSSKSLKDKKEKCRILTLVRDPVATFLSHVFQNPKIHRPQLLGTDGCLDKVKVDNYVSEQFANFDPEGDFIANWFGSEFFEFTGIDVYEYPFDALTGATIIRNEFCDVAILSLETLESNLNSAVKHLTGRDWGLMVEHRNVRSLSKEAELYLSIKKDVTVCVEDLEKIYSTKYARHFFAEDHRLRMIDKWSKSRNI